MPDRDIPERPNLEQYKKQAKELARDCAQRQPAALDRIRRHHPRLRNRQELPAITLADAQLVLAREHGFPSWPQFAAHLETLRIIRSLEDLPDPVNTFIEVAVVPRHGWHASGTLEHAELILARYPHVATANIYTASVLADEATVRKFLSQNPALATATGGPHNWDALTCLAFSRYLRLDKSRSEAFVPTARALLDAGASANSGWMETIDDGPPIPRNRPLRRRRSRPASRPHPPPARIRRRSQRQRDLLPRTGNLRQHRRRNPHRLRPLQRAFPRLARRPQSRLARRKRPPPRPRRRRQPQLHDPVAPYALPAFHPPR
jgi:hypothetical protein